MKYLAITGTLFITLIAAVFGYPLLNTVLAAEMNSAQIESVAGPSAVEELTVAESVEAESNTEAQSIPVTDAQSVAIPVIEVAEAADIDATSGDEAEASSDNVLLEAAAQADAEVAAEFAALDEFVASVTNGYSNLVTGVYVPGALALPIIQQPSGNAGHITLQDGAATQFGMASSYGAIGILAHNYLAGAEFFEMEVGMEVFIVYGDGSYETYLITEIRRFQALSPNSPYSSFLDLDNNNAQLSAAQLFDQIYNQSGNVIFQTCIDANGISTWGRIFVSAELIG